MTSTKGNDTLMPEAMKVERAEALGADLYERTPDRTGYACERSSDRRSGTSSAALPRKKPAKDSVPLSRATTRPLPSGADSSRRTLRSALQSMHCRVTFIESYERLTGWSL
jgi:hypothetical protein